jgi:GT2 family glycosyltransferase
VAKYHDVSNSERDGTLTGSPSWRPVTLIQVDVDNLPSGVAEDATPGDRVWIEATKHGQVLGIIEARAGGEGLSASVLRELVGIFSGVELSDYRDTPDDALPKASVVVPTICQDPIQLTRTVAALLAMNYPNFEIIVVDNRAGRGNTIFPDLPGGAQVTVVEEPVPGISAARNRGSTCATGDFVAFTDDDAVVDQDWLRALGARFVTEPEVDAIGGLVLPLELDTAPQLWFEEFYGGFSRSFQPETVSIERMRGQDPLFPYAPGRLDAGCNMAFRRSTLQQMGGFNISLGTGTLARGGEDLASLVELLLSGGTLAFEPAALVRHSHRKTEREFMKQVFGYGTGLTAMYTALVVRHPAQIFALLRRIPAGLSLLTRPSEQRSPSRTPSYPGRTLFQQVLGMAYGPIAYARSVNRTRQAK